MTFYTSDSMTMGEKIQKGKLNLHFTLHTKINFKWIIDLNMKCNIRLLKESIGGNLYYHGLGKEFQDMTQKS